VLRGGIGTAASTILPISGRNTPGGMRSAWVRILRTRRNLRNSSEKDGSSCIRRTLSSRSCLTCGDGGGTCHVLPRLQRCALAHAQKSWATGAHRGSFNLDLKATLIRLRTPNPSKYGPASGERQLLSLPREHPMLWSRPGWLRVSQSDLKAEVRQTLSR
jgi:hypothetical protein